MVGLLVRRPVQSPPARAAVTPESLEPPLRRSGQRGMERSDAGPPAIGMRTPVSLSAPPLTA